MPSVKSPRVARMSRTPRTSVSQSALKLANVQTPRIDAIMFEENPTIIEMYVALEALKKTSLPN